jgi:ParB family chromosome partitioning protein
MARKKVELRQLMTLPIEQVVRPAPQPRPPREEEVEELARSFAERGQAPPVLVRDNGRGTYTLMAGAATLEAVLRTGWAELDCIVVGPESEKELEVVERLQRNHFEPWELADAIHALKRRYGWTQAQLGQAIGRTRDFVANLLAITQIAPEVRKHIRRHDQGDELTTRHLRYVARTPRSEQMRVAQRILEQTVSTKELEREKRLSTLKSLDTHVIRVRAPRTPGSGLAPKSPKEWRRYHRQLVTDLRRIDRQEAQEQRRAQARMAEAKQRLKLVRGEANRKRRQLGRELRQVKKQLLRLGS